MDSIDPEVLFQSNSEYLTLSQSLTVLEQQLSQAYRDIETLQRLKADALSSPEEFLETLLPRGNKLSFPLMQQIFRIPEIDLSKYSKRTTRRGSSKYDQNLEYFVTKIMQVQRQRSYIPPVGISALFIQALLSTSIPVQSTPSNGPSVATAVRERFFEIAGRPKQPPRSMSAPAIAVDLEPPPPSVGIVASPPASSLKRMHRVPLSEATPIAAHYNLPWSEEEKRRMNELLLIYPEEEVQSRRYAKIAAALGTRTASQVANRVNKLAAKNARQLLSGSSTPTRKRKAEGLDDSEIPKDMKNTAEYVEYMRLKAQIESLETQ